MNKVLIDRELAERVCHVDNSTRQTARRELRTILATPSGTPAMPVKAYYHEAPNECGGLNKSVGLEVRKEFTDAPLVLESDALARVACLEGEIAKRDEELSACRVSVENCEVFRARIGELESLSVTKAMLDIVPGDGDGYEVYAKSVSDVETKLGALGEENEELQFERDQQARRIGELASHLEFAVTLLTVAGLAGNAQVEAMRAALSARGAPK